MSISTPKWQVIESCESMMLIIVDSFAGRRLQILKNQGRNRFAVESEMNRFTEYVIFKRCGFVWV